jgi:hypothetical protein
MLVAWIQKCTQKLGMILGEGFATCLLLYILCLKHQKKHQFFQEMIQSCLEKEIDIPKNVQTMLKLCLIIRCQWIQLGSNHIDNNVNEVWWWYVLGWQNFKSLSVCRQTSLVGWFVALSKRLQMVPMFAFLVNVQWTHEKTNFPIAYA